MTKRVFTTPQADGQIAEIDAWWRQNREKAPNLFEEELALAFTMIADSPGAGRRYAGHRDVRRILLRSTRNHLYYVERDDGIIIVAVWGAVKGTGPNLSGV